jgi:hypothetical protein
MLYGSMPVARWIRSSIRWRLPLRPSKAKDPSYGCQKPVPGLLGANSPIFPMTSQFASSLAGLDPDPDGTIDGRPPLST